VQTFYNLPGISITTLSSSHTIPFAMVTDWIIEKIPGVRNWKADPETVQKRLGVFGEPIILGLVIGLALGILGFYNAENAVVLILQTGMNLAAVMILLPRMAKLLMEGLLPISEAAREFMARRKSDREIFIGLDSAIIIGHESTMSASFILVPIAIVLSIILPGNRVILFADLAAIPFFVVMFGPLMKGNIFRMTVAGTLFLIAGFYMATAMGPLFTRAAENAGFAIPENAAMITAMGDGFMWTPFVFAKLSQWLGLIGILVFAVLTAVAWFFYLKNPKSWELSVGAPSED
jgi:galactitol PTS system EIIC component